MSIAPNVRILPHRSSIYRKETHLNIGQEKRLKRAFASALLEERRHGRNNASHVRKEQECGRAIG